MKIDEAIVEQAYKKLKSNVYYDRTQLWLRNAIVEFEQKLSNDEIDKKLSALFDSLRNKDEFNRVSNQICKQIQVMALPKKLSPPSSNGDSVFQKGNSLITNYAPQCNKVSEFQYYIDMPVEGHILGVLWIMLVGYRIANQIYEHSYGNRIRKKLINELSEKPTYSPYLFEPYFEQYESWRDKALDEASSHMKSGQDVVIITMDFQRYYYSLDVDNAVMDRLFELAQIEDADSEYKDICRRLSPRCFEL